MNKSFIKKPDRFHELLEKHRLETGFSMLEAVVVVGVLLALAIGGFFAYGPITENAKRAKVKSAASEVHTGVVVASIDGDAATNPEDVVTTWNASTGKIRTEILGSGANGDFCVQATNVESPYITEKSGACDGVVSVPGLDTDGDGIPDASDPDIDGDGIPNATDPSPNGGGVPVSNKCDAMTVDAQVSCWHDEFVAAQNSYESANGYYFGIAQYWNQPSYDFSPPEMTGSPLKYGATQETYRDSDPQWDYNYYSSVIVDRDGYFWTGGYYHEITGPDSEADPFEKTYNNHNINYACDFVTPADLNNLCTTVGIHQEKYVVASGTGDSVAEADIAKVLQAQLGVVQSTQELYGGYSQTVDVQSWAGTTYPTKVWNVPSSGAWDNNIYTRVMVTAPNGDLYTVQYRFWKTAPTMADAVRTYKYTGEMVDRVCSRPFTATYNQTSDIGTCTSLGFPNFHP